MSNKIPRYEVQDLVVVARFVEVGAGSIRSEDHRSIYGLPGTVFDSNRRSSDDHLQRTDEETSCLLTRWCYCSEVPSQVVYMF